MLRTHFSKLSLTHFLGLALILAVLVACGPQKDQPIDQSTTPADTAEEADAPAPQADMRDDATGNPATAQLMGREGSGISGEVIFTELEDGKVRVSARVIGIDGEGKHGFHIHETGDCSAPDFTSAGGHFNPQDMPHGAPTDGERHVGDLGNVEVQADGSVLEEMELDMLSLSGPNSILGKAVILHAQADDLVTQPTGDAGGRIACGVIRPGGDETADPMGGGTDDDDMDAGGPV